MRSLPDEKINTKEHEIKIKASEKILLEIELFSNINFNITDTTKSPAMGWNADKTRPEKISK